MNYQPSTPELLRVAGLPEDTILERGHPDYRHIRHQMELARSAFYTSCGATALEACTNCLNRAERMCDLADKVFAEHGIRVITASEIEAEIATQTDESLQ